MVVERGEVVVGLEQWAEIRRLAFVRRLSIKEIVRRTGHGRNTVRRALRSGGPPRHDQKIGSGEVASSTVGISYGDIGNACLRRQTSR
jgi:hypothetical protein